MSGSGNVMPNEEKKKINQTNNKNDIPNINILMSENIRQKKTKNLGIF